MFVSCARLLGRVQASLPSIEASNQARRSLSVALAALPSHQNYLQSSVSETVIPLILRQHLIFSIH